MFDTNNPFEFSALLTSLKPSVLSASLILMEMLKDNKKEIPIDEDDAKSIVALLMFDNLVKADCGYTYLDDFDFSSGESIRLRNKDIDSIKKHVEFMLEYLMYRIEAPIDIGNC